VRVAGRARTPSELLAMAAAARPAAATPTAAPRH
jgi:hypothetical protein